MQTVTQLVTQDSAAPVTATMDGMQQESGDFAGVLSGIQLMAKDKELADSGQKVQFLIKSDMNQVPPDVHAEDPAADLQTRLQVSPGITTASGSAAPKKADPEKVEVFADAAPPSIELSDVTSQMLLAAYSQVGRMPEVNKPTPLPVDRLQNVAAVMEQPVVITAPAVKTQLEQASVAAGQPTAQQPAVLLAEQPVLQAKPTAATPQAVAPTVTASPTTPVSAVPTAVQTEAPLKTAEVNKPTPLPVDRLQNVAAVTEQPAVVTAPAVKTQPEQASVAAGQPTAQQPAVLLAEQPVVEPVGQNQQHQAATVQTTTVDEQPATTIAAAPVLQAKPTAAPPQAVAPTVTASATTPVATAPTAVPAEAPSRTAEVNKQTPLPVDRLQNVAAVSEQPAVVTAPDVKTQPEQASVAAGQPTAQQPAVLLAEQPVLQAKSIAAPPQAVAPTVTASPTTPVSAVPTAVQAEAPLKTAEVNKPTPLPVDRLQNVAAVTEQPAVVTDPADKSQLGQTVAEPVQIIPDGNAAAASITPKSEQPTANLNTQAPVLSPVAEVEIRLSQPLPITIQVTAATAVTGNRSAAMVQGIPGARQRLIPEQQIEKGNETSVVKELASSLRSAASVGESTLGSETSGGDSSQGQPDSASDNQMLAQQMRGQLSTEHQKIATLSAKAAPTEPVRQDIPEQVMQQVKDRLVQHDIKPGNQQITLTLSPDSLGELKMNLNLQGQKLSVEIVTENRTVRDAIIQHTDALKESLARQNITMESFDVTTGGKGSGNQGQNQNAWRELAKQQQQQHWTSPRGYHTAQADVPSGQATYQRQQVQSMLDIHY
jgi:hypothetical protein